MKSDHHRYNVKAQLRGNAPLDEVQFVKAVGELDESISGSESSESDDDEAEAGTDTTLTALLKRQAKLSGSKTICSDWQVIMEMYCTDSKSRRVLTVKLRQHRITMPSVAEIELLKLRLDHQFSG